MERLNPEKLHVTDLTGGKTDDNNPVRRYTLTHSDFTGDLFLTIGPDYDMKQCSGWYTRMMRDEVLAEFVPGGDRLEFKVYCHVSGGLVFGTAALRNKIFRAELRLALEAIRYGGRDLFESNPDLDRSTVKICFRSHKSKYHCEEDWGILADYR